MEPDHLTVSQNNWDKPELFDKLVLWNRPQGVRSQKTHNLIYDLLSVWTKEMNAILFFPLHQIPLCWIESESHCIVIGVNRIASCFICIFSVSYRWLCIIYIYAFSRRFYPKRLTIAFRLYIFISTCVPWESNPQPFAQQTQCSTTEPHRNIKHQDAYRIGLSYRDAHPYNIVCRLDE